VNPGDDRLLIYNIDPDTEPQNTLDPVTAVINPLTSAPLDGLDSSQNGQRYLLTESTGNANNTQNPTAWLGVGGQPLIANANDIIEYQNGWWQVSFDSQLISVPQYVTNLNTGIQFRWTGSQWVKSIDGLYNGGSWSIVL
jgi:hypothetical protein